MATRISVIANCDDAVIFWRIKKRIPDCLGFSIEREMKADDGAVKRITLDNRTGFAKDKPGLGEHRPSTIWPFQRFWWADHSVNLGDSVRYRACPMVLGQGTLQELIDERSDWTRWTQLTGKAADGFSSFFNRGLVISQFMARYLEDLRRKKGLATRRAALLDFKKHLGEHELPIRKFLSGALRTQMLQFLSDAGKDGLHVFGALYELEDEELIDGLKALGKRAHIVLANGSISPKKGVPAAEARKLDQNKAGRKAIRDANVEVFDRFISPGALGHNKFLVTAKKSGDSFKAREVWTGSTNWTSTALCTQVNNGLLVRNADVAGEYLEQFDRLRDAESGFPKELVEANLQVKKATSGSSKVDIWFTRNNSKSTDLAAIDEVINGAKDGVLFLMFQPGGAGALGTVRKLQAKKKDLYIRGVVSTLPPKTEEDETEVDVTVVGDTESPKRNFEIVQPEGANAFANWAATVTRGEFLLRPTKDDEAGDSGKKSGVIGFAIVHSKLIVVDPFTKPVVITGSHNFSSTASKKNDENFMIVRGNQALAEHYAAHILSVYHHYSWLSFVRDQQKKGKDPGGFLRDHDTWQDPRLKGNALKELDFFLP